MLKNLLLPIFFLGSALGQWDPNFASDRYGIVHLFEWHWDTIADECENLLAPNKVGGVQTSPPSENRIIDSRPWWERYQPISYHLETRSGNRQAFIDMVNRCNAVGVHIYPDIVINHMCGGGGSGTGTGGSYFDADILEFPAVPYGGTDFHSQCDINNYGDAWQVRNCWLVNLTDLDQSKDYVRSKMIDFMNDMIDIGVAGFRVDACKHMYPSDLDAIFGGLHDLRSDVFGSGKRAYIYQEVIDQGGEPITASEYTYVGSVTEFKYGLKLGQNKHSLQYLSTFGESWGMLNGYNALAFINNHDNQRGHGGGGDIITFEEPFDLKIFTGYMLAWPYGVPRVMSSYYFSNADEGPPANQRSVNTDGSCGNGWVCEHRWRQIKNMFSFAVAVVGTQVDNWWDNGDNQIAFSRGSKGFFAANAAGYGMNENLYTGLPDGSYCNVISGDFYDGKCAGTCVSVSGGYTNVNIQAGSEDPIFAIHVDAMTTDCNAGGGISGGGNGGGNGFETTCVDCTCADSEKLDCGELASTEASCTASGCLWCPSNTRLDVPWCFHKASSYVSTSSPNGGSGGTTDQPCVDCNCPSHKKSDCGFIGVDMNGCVGKGCIWCEDGPSGDPWCFYPDEDGDGNGVSGTESCYIDESSRTECGYYGIQQTECESSGCCWEESNTNGVPWCYNQVST